MSRELRDIETKLLSRGGRSGRNSFRANAGTDRALARVSSQLTREGKREKRDYAAQVRGGWGSSASRRYAKTATRFNRLSKAKNYLERRSARNAQRFGLSGGDR